MRRNAGRTAARDVLKLVALVLAVITSAAFFSVECGPCRVNVNNSNNTHAREVGDAE